MSISFEHTILFMDEILGQSEIKDLANFIFLNKILATDSAIILRTCDTEKKFNSFIVSFLLKNLNNNGAIELVNYFRRAYKLAFKPPRDIKCMYNEPNSKKRLDLVRGGILEALMQDIMYSRTYSVISDNCRILIDGAEQIAPSYKYAQTMDVAGIDSPENTQQGEMFEGKVGYNHINFQDIAFIQHLVSAFQIKQYSGILVGLICLENELQLQSHITKKLKMNYKHILSRDYIQDLWDYDKLKKRIS